MRLAVTCGLATAVMLGNVLGTAAPAAEPTLDLTLGAPETVEAGDEQIQIGGPFVTAGDGATALGIGSDFGPAIPASPFFGPTGTIAFTLSYEEPEPDNRLVNRHVVTVRMEGRGFFGFYFIQQSRHLEMSYKQLPEAIRVVSPDRLEPGRAYRVAATWDGRVVCFFLDGVLIGEMAQGFPADFPPYSRLNLGPYQDGWITARPWGADDVAIRDLKVWGEVLEPQEVAADAGVETTTAWERYPTALEVPRTAAPEIDGRLDDPTWRQAASPVSLIDQSRPEMSLSYPDNRPLFAHDGENLYIAFETVFPPGAAVITGRARGETEPEVWADESFELYLDVDGRLYRFAGNPAGGYTESVDGDTGFSGPWEYASNLEFRIDDRYHWQGEIRIPFETIGLGEPIGRDLSVNFCRTWRALDEIGITSLQPPGGQNYGDRSRFVVLRPVSGTEGAVVSDSTDPSFGDFQQTVAVHSDRGGEFVYSLSAVNLAGDGATTLEERITLEPGGRTELFIEHTITTGAARALLFRLQGPDERVLMQQVVPFRLSEDYLSVTPVFGAGQVLLTPRYSVLRGKHPDVAPSVRILGPAGESIHEVEISSDDRLTVPFDRDRPIGTYTAQMISGEGDALTVHTSKRFRYTGRAPYETYPAPEMVIPPFEPLRSSHGGNQVEVAIWGRRYEFADSLLPTAVSSQDRELLAGPVRLLIGGEPVPATSVEVRDASDLRLEYTAAVERDDCTLHQEAWVEYDGVFFNRIEVHAREDLGALVLSVPLQAETARFAHVTASGFGGGGGENLWLDQDHELPFYPSVWVGHEEGGLAWFAETAASWRTDDARPVKFVRDGEATRLEVTFADGLPAGSDLSVEFGLLATPVKPLPDDYPMNLFSDTFAVHLNRPEERQPVITAGVASWEGAGFFDLPLDEEEPETWQWLVRNHTRCEENGAIFTPYTAAMLLPEEYEDVASRISEWQLTPARHLSYERDGQTRDWLWTCPASDAGAFFAWKFDQLLDRIPLRGIYLDFGPAYRCGNALHGCRDRFPLLAQRRLYQNLAASFVRRGVEDYVITVHNSESVQWPTFTHVTHSLNGEGLRQMSSTVFHDGKDLQDTYTRLDFAAEHSSLPHGITCSVYVPVDPLLAQFGGGIEDPELYRFRMTKAALAGTLLHNTIPSPMRTHYGWYDKIIRIYEQFDVPAAEFLPYWRNERMVRVTEGRDIYVSLFRSEATPEVLAVISHMGPDHINQQVAVEFSPEALGLNELTAAEELLTAPDPEYDRLYEETNRIRIPIEPGDFGVENVRLEGNVVRLDLDFHSVALVRLTGAR